MGHPFANRPRDSLGYRAIFGVLVPYTNTIVQPEFEDFRPHGVTNHIARMEQTGIRPFTDDAASMEFYRQRLMRDSEHVKKAVAEVLPAEPHAIIVGHSIDSFRGGVAGAHKMKEELETFAKGVPVILPAQAFLAALKALGVGKRMSIITPYFPPGDEQVRAFFEDAGFEVVRLIGMKCGRSVEIAATQPPAVMRVLKELAADKPDVIVQPGTNMSTARISADASDWLGIPVVSCNTATYWHALRTMGIEDRKEGFGPLLAAH